MSTTVLIAALFGYSRYTAIHFISMCLSYVYQKCTGMNIRKEPNACTAAIQEDGYIPSHKASRCTF